MKMINVREVNLHLVTDGLGDSSYLIKQHTVRYQALLEIFSFIFRFTIRVKRQEKVKKVVNLFKFSLGL